MKRALGAFALLSVLLTACSALGYVPQEDLEAAQSAQATAQAERGAAQVQVATLQAQVDELQGQVGRLDQVQGDLEAARGTIANLQGRVNDAEERLTALICPNHDFQEALDIQGLFPLRGADDVIEPIFQNYVEFTEWRMAPGWVGNIPSTTLLWDTDDDWSLIIDTEEDCVIPNPDYWGDSFFR